MNLIKVTDDIFHYENLLTPEECEKVIKLFHRLEEENPDYWKSISFYESYSGSYPEDNNPLMAEVGLSPTWFRDLEDKFRNCAAEVAGQTPEKMSKISFHVQRWLAGAFAPKHSDNSDNDGNLGAFTRSRYAGFLYLNDNFEGGLLKFEADHGKNNFSIQPTVGSFYIFHGGHKNMHEVTLVKNGTRYTIGSFWDDREEEDYPQELRDKWATELAEVRAYQKDQAVEWQDLRDKGVTQLPNGTVVPAEEVGRI
jgi:hypothetical protein